MQYVNDKGSRCNAAQAIVCFLFILTNYYVVDKLPTSNDGEVSRTHNKSMTRAQDALHLKPWYFFFSLLITELQTKFQTPNDNDVCDVWMGMGPRQ